MGGRSKGRHGGPARQFRLGRVEQTVLEPGAPVPLIAYPAPSLSRKLAIDALEAEGRTWRITCSTKQISGVLAAVRAGIGVA